MSKSSFSIAGITAAPGAREAKVLDLTLAGTATKLPLFVLNGAHEGPTVLVTAAIHGGEYVGTAAAMQLALTTDLATLRGQLVIAPIASMTAYAKRAIYIAPPDNKNLNRCFPGKADGSFAEQLAHWIFTNLISKADFYIDCHGGDINEALVPFSVVSISGNAAVDAKSMKLAEAFGIRYILTSEVKGSTVSAAATIGVPAVLTEVGGQGQWSPAEVKQMYDGLISSLAFAGSLASGFKAMPTQVLEHSAWMRSDHDGLWYPQVKVGDTVKTGQNLGHVTDFLGNTVQTAVASMDGIVMFVVSTLAMNAGDPLLSIAA